VNPTEIFLLDFSISEKLN